MRHAIGLSLTLAFAATALLVSPSSRAQSADPNSAPNPYKAQENWAQYPQGRKPGAAIKVQVDHSDGRSIYVFDRCAANDCSGSTLPPILEFDASGKFMRAFGGMLFNQPHGLYVDRQGNVWATDQIEKSGRGDVLVKFGRQGDVQMVLGRPGVPGKAAGMFDQPSAVVVAPNGDIYVADGHGGKSNDRIVKFSQDGRFITSWGKHGKARGEFDTPHGIALDSAGRVYVGDRVNSRVEVFDPNGKFIAEWRQFGRPSDVVIDKNDMIYVADSQSTPQVNPGFQQGIRIGSVKDGKVTAFIPAPDGVGAESVGVDDAGNVYGGWTNKPALRRYVKN